MSVHKTLPAFELKPRIVLAYKQASGSNFRMVSQLVASRIEFVSRNATLEVGVRLGEWFGHGRECICAVRGLK